MGGVEEGRREGGRERVGGVEEGRREGGRHLGLREGRKLECFWLVDMNTSIYTFLCGMCVCAG